MKKLKGNKKGFTLIEMIVVIVIIAILAAIAVPAIMKYVDDARDTKLIAQGHSAMVTTQATLTKAEGKSTSGLFAETDLTAALTEAKADNGSVDTIQVCTNEIAEPVGDAGAGNCTPPVYSGANADAKVNKVKTYIIKIGDKNVYVPVSNSGAAFVK